VIRSSISFAIAMVVLSAAGSSADAASAPGTMTFSARLRDGDVPFQGNLGLRLALHRSPTPDASVPALWTEDYQPTADQGLVTVLMGQQTPLTSALVAGGALYLEVTVTDSGGATTPLEPRLAVGSVPYALVADYARDTAAVPTGAVMHFDLEACPVGWTALDGARGRALVGVPAGGTVGGTAGDAPLGDREDRAHSHIVDPAAVQSTEAGSHSHSAGGVPSTSGATVPHTHRVDPAPFQISGGSHNHIWSQFFTGSGLWVSGDLSLLHNWNGGSIGGGSGTQPLRATFDTGTSKTYSTSTSQSHTHDIDVGATTTAELSDTTHSHAMPIPADGVHRHSCDVAATTSNAATTGQIIPYLQLLVCRKD
jgi:hypothetical protein